MLNVPVNIFSVMFGRSLEEEETSLNKTHKVIRTITSSSLGKTDVIITLELINQHDNNILGITNKNIIMSSFKSSRDIQKKEGGPDSCFG